MDTVSIERNVSLGYWMIRYPHSAEPEHTEFRADVDCEKVMKHYQREYTVQCKLTDILPLRGKK